MKLTAKQRKALSTKQFVVPAKKAAVKLTAAQRKKVDTNRVSRGGKR